MSAIMITKAQDGTVTFKPVPPAKRWRMLWGTTSGEPLALNNRYKRTPYDTACAPVAFHPYVCAGPICPSAEIAEHKAEGHYQGKGEEYRNRVIPIRPVAVDADGIPIA